MSFHVGQKVVCVDAAPDAGKRWVSSEQPVVGAIYTVSAAEFTSPINGRRCIGIAELSAPRSGGHRTSRFRPIVERKTDISIFTAMLKPQQVDA